MSDHYRGRSSRNETTALYLFCIARAHGLPAPEGRGPDDRYPLSQWAFRDLAAVVSKVELAEFCGAVGEANLQDLAWLGPRACRHEAVVERVMRHSPVLPARFGLVSGSEEEVKRLLAKYHPVLREYVRRLENRIEVAVKVFWRKDRMLPVFAGRSMCRASAKPATLQRSPMCRRAI